MPTDGMQPAMNNPYSAAGGAAAPRPPPQGARSSMPPPRPPSLDGSHSGDFRLAPSYQAPPGASWSGGQFPSQPHLFPSMGNVGGYDQATAAAVAAAQQNLSPFGRPPAQQSSSSPTDTARQQQQQQQQYYNNANSVPGQPSSTGQTSGQTSGPSPPNVQQPSYVPRLDIGYMNLPVWGEDGRRDDDRNPQSAGPGGAGSVPDGPRSNTGPGGPGGPNGPTANGEPSVPSQRAGSTVVKAEPEDDKPQPEEDKVDHRKRKRNRTIRSCVPCHNHKRKCDRKRPCGRCTALGLTGSCVYEVDEARDPNDPDVIETDRLRRRIAELEQVVRELRQRHPGRGQAAAAAAAAAQPIPPVQAPTAPITEAEKRRVIVDRYARFKIGEAVATVGNANLGTPSNHPAGSTSELSPSSSSVASGRQPQYAEPYSAGALPGEEMVSDTQGRKTFLGTPAGKPMMRRLREIVHGKGKGPDEIMSVPEDLAFTGWFASTRKTYPFTTIWSHDTFIDEIVDLLPNKEDAELLLNAFVDEIAVLFQAWHMPTLKAEYRAFFAMSPAEKRKQPLAHLALCIMICSLGCMVRASGNEIMGADQMPKAPTRDDCKDLTSSRLQSELYLSAAYQALRLCSFLSTPSIGTIQTQVLINVYLLHSERAADSWALTGSLVRQCIAMGLHVDPAVLDSKISFREAEVRRRVWWTVAGLEALLCVSFGRPTCINFYTCQLPQDRPDDTLSDEPGSAILEPSSNALNPATTDETYHAAYFQITLPSFDLLNRTFHVSPLVARNSYMGWFTPSITDDPPVQPPSVVGNTYEDAIRLGRDIFDWYSHVPEGMRFDPNDPELNHLKGRSRSAINQTLALAVKTFILVLILHRPYLRADPSAYPESSHLCGKAAHLILQAYRTMVRTKASIVWSWWTMSYRAFHAGTVCAFLAIREPSSELAERCLADLRGAITIFEDRTANWMAHHPVQSDLCGGLVRLEKLATAATQQHSPHLNEPTMSRADQVRRSPATPVFPRMAMDPSIPSMPSVAIPPHHESLLLGDSMPNSGPGSVGPIEVDSRRPSGPFLQPWAVPHLDSMHHAYGLEAQLPPMTSNGKDDAQDLVQIWASMFNIKMDPDMDLNSHSHGMGGMPPPQ